MPGDKIKTLSDFVARVHAIRQDWRVPQHKELWFRGEGKKHETLLRPKLYRASEGRSMKPVSELEEQDRDWDWYFLMQHHGAPTRLLDWSDGALSALHFALRDKSKHDTEDAQIYALEPDRLQDRLKALPEIEMAKQRWELYKEKHPFHNRGKMSGNMPICPATEKISKSFPYRGCRCCWIFLTSRAGSLPSAAAS
jgi:hypothetical protein